MFARYWYDRLIDAKAYSLPPRIAKFIYKMGKDMYENLRPGCAICKSGTDARGTLTCFARWANTPPDGPVLLGVTAAHVLKPFPALCEFEGKVISYKAEYAGRLDLAVFRIHNVVSEKLGENNFIPLGHTVEPLQLWNPQKFVAKVNAKEASERAKGEITKLPINVLGSTQIGNKGNSLTLTTPGNMEKYTDGFTARIQDSSLAKGDSGGSILKYKKDRNNPFFTAKAIAHGGGFVLDEADLKYVGLLSSGHGEINSAGGQVLFLKPVFEMYGLVLATWSDRDHWLSQ